MRSALITFFACFLGMLAALLVYHQYRKHEEAQAEAARDVALQARVEQGRKLAEKMIAEYATAQVLREDSVGDACPPGMPRLAWANRQVIADKV